MQMQKWSLKKTIIIKPEKKLWDFNYKRLDLTFVDFIMKMINDTETLFE